MQFLRDLRTLLRHRYFRRLFAVRLVSQLSDGIFQVALASYVLFSPERQPNATAIAIGFAVLLLPFSLLGPFCGVLLDRWSRRQTLLWSNVIRTGLVLVVIATVLRDNTGPLFFLAVLACLSVNRFLLAALSAALPHVVPTNRLVMANAVSPTCGTLAFLLGLAVGSGLEAVSPVTGRGTDVVVLGVGGLGYLTSALLALRMPRRLLGPDLRTEQQYTREAVRHVVRGLVDGARHVLDRRPAAFGLAAIGAHRFFYGIFSVVIILLYRNYFEPNNADAGIAGLATAVLASGIGFGAAALLTPIVVRRIRKEAWIVILLLAAAVVVLVPGALFTQPAVLVTAFVLGITAQGIKICVDTLVQENIDDAYRGRVFSLYDVLFNVLIVASAACAAATLPATGKSYLVLVVASIAYVVTALVYARATGVGTRPRSPADGRSEGTLR
ncbi:MFS transporter [Actinopolymorpha pittospori]|uniref:MFS family permease n=1 Tax=Actinopolymorpha pittospori TaxID=648752 RepID=A0A927MQT9_9ACTN|nr:MFS family permease [Actinopolymorpha pittospori]